MLTLTTKDIRYIIRNLAEENDVHIATHSNIRNNVSMWYSKADRRYTIKNNTTGDYFSATNADVALGIFNDNLYKS